MLPNDNSTALVLLTPEAAMQQARASYQIVKQMRESLLVVNVDFGTIPGTDKPTLLKPGAEKLCRAFGYDPVFETVSKIEHWEDDAPLFHYEIRCRLIRIEDGKEVATGIGSCNSKENRYRWRWVDEDDVPAYLDKSKLKIRSSARSEFAFAIERRETSGQYGKPAEYWAEWQKAIDSGKARKIQKATRTGKQMDAYEMGSLSYRIPNDEVFSLVNTIEKMATKRALVAAVLIGVGASEFFTQDMEDLRDFSDVVEGVFEEVVDATADMVKTEPTEKSWTPVWLAFKEAGFTPGNAEQIKLVFKVGDIAEITPAEALVRLKTYRENKPTYGQSSVSSH